MTTPVGGAVAEDREGAMATPSGRLKQLVYAFLSPQTVAGNLYAPPTWFTTAVQRPLLMLMTFLWFLGQPQGIMKPELD